jgi:hypothetical protein
MTPHLRRLLPALLAAASLAATIPAALPPDAGARPARDSVPPDRIALVERASTARWVP